MAQYTDNDDLRMPADSDSIDIRRYLSLFISNWYWFAISLFFSVAIAYGINRYSERIWSVTSTLLIKDDQKAGLSDNVGNVIPGGDIFRSRQNLRNEMGILKSYRLNYLAMKEIRDFHVVYTGIGRRNIVETKMYKTCPVLVVYDSVELMPRGLQNEVTIELVSDSTFKIDFGNNGGEEGIFKLGDRINQQRFDFIIFNRFPGKRIYTDNTVRKFRFYFIGPEALANQYRNKLSVEPIEEDASIVTLSVTGPVMEQEIDYLNKLMEIYLEYGLNNKNQTADSTIEFIDRQLNVISKDLAEAENRLEDFRLNNRFIDLSREGDLLQARLERFEIEKAGFELQKSYYNYLAGYLETRNESGAIVSPSVTGITDQVLIRLVNDLSSFQREREKLALNISSGQPSFGLIDKQVDEARKALQENVRNGIESLRLSIAESDRKIAGVAGEIDRLPGTEKELLGIERDFDLNNTVYTYLLEKRAESGIARASNIPDNRIVDYASQFSSWQVKPKKRNNYMIALVLGLFIPVAGITLIDYLNDKIIDRRDIEKKTRVPIIGYISHNAVRNEIPVVENTGSSLAESFRSVRTAIKYFIKDKRSPVIAISSTISSEGKTFIAVNLAAITAMLGKKVLLVGLDLRKPRIGRILEFDESPGMSGFLSKSCSYREVIKETQTANLWYAPSGPVPPNPAELIETEEMKLFIDRARQEFDYIIIDTPPVAIVTDALLLAPYADLNLFVVRQRYTSRQTLGMIEQLRNDGDMKNMAIVINDISLSGYYGYGLRYGYSLGYGYIYGYNYYNSYGRYGYAKDAKGYYVDD